MDRPADMTAWFGDNGDDRLDPGHRGTMAESLESLLACGSIVPASLCRLPQGIAGVVDQKERSLFFGVARASRVPRWMTDFKGDFFDRREFRVLMAATDPGNASVLRRFVARTRPQPLGVRPSFGFGDRIGLATPGHAMAAAAAGGTILPVFAQQSIREMSRCQRTPEQVMADATWGVFRTGWHLPFGADADHLKTASDVDVSARAGFVFFTIDPSDHVDHQADLYSRAEIDAKFQKLWDDRVPGVRTAVQRYGGKTYTFEGDQGRFQAVFDDVALKRAVVKYIRALEHTYRLAMHIGNVMQDRPYELELSVDETPQPTSVLEHLFIALELKRHDVRVVSIAPRFVGTFEKGVDYKGDVSRFEESLARHAAVAHRFGPYKIGVHSGSDKFSIYPSIARICQGRFHVKTAGTSYLEALRVICRVDKPLFRVIISLARRHFEEDRFSYSLSTGLDRVPGENEIPDEELEAIYLDRDFGRQILHVTFGSVLAQKNRRGVSRGQTIRGVLRRHARLHEEVLQGHIGRHLKLLRAS